jgi:hypothetical protein
LICCLKGSVGRSYCGALIYRPLPLRKRTGRYSKLAQAIPLEIYASKKQRFGFTRMRGQPEDLRTKKWQHAVTILRSILRPTV